MSRKAKAVVNLSILFVCGMLCGYMQLSVILAVLFFLGFVYFSWSAISAIEQRASDKAWSAAGVVRSKQDAYQPDDEDEDFETDSSSSESPSSQSSNSSQSSLPYPTEPLPRAKRL